MQQIESELTKSLAEVITTNAGLERLMGQLGRHQETTKELLELAIEGKVEQKQKAKKLEEGLEGHLGKLKDLVGLFPQNNEENAEENAEENGEKNDLETPKKAENQDGEDEQGGALGNLSQTPAPQPAESQIPAEALPSQPVTDAPEATVDH